MRMSEANEPIKIPNMMPKEIVAHLDKYIIGQDEAKKSIAIAIRNRYRRSRLPKEMQEEISPSNIIMMGPTGVGKTEIVRRVSKILGTTERQRRRCRRRTAPQRPEGDLQGKAAPSRI